GCGSDISVFRMPAWPRTARRSDWRAWDLCRPPISMTPPPSLPKPDHCFSAGLHCFIAGCWHQRVRAAIGFVTGPRRTRCPLVGPRGEELVCLGGEKDQQDDQTDDR